MSSVNKRLAAGGAVAALAAATFAVPANAASSAALNYDCGTNGTFVVTHSAPSTVVFGDTAVLSSSIAVPNAARDALVAGNVIALAGAITTEYQILGNKATFPQGVGFTPVSGAAPLVINASTPIPTATFKAAVGLPLPITAGDPASAADLVAGATIPGKGQVPLVEYGGNPPAPVGAFAFTCALNAGQPTAVATMLITKAPTSTVATLTKPAKHKLVAKAVVTSSTAAAIKDGTPGQVKFILKRAGKVVAKKTKDLSIAGTAKSAFPKLRKGKYTVVVKYLGSSTFLKSSATSAKKRA